MGKQIAGYEGVGIVEVKSVRVDFSVAVGVAVGVAVCGAVSETVELRASDALVATLRIASSLTYDTAF